MVTKLHGLLRREVDIKGRAYVVGIDESGIKLTLKGHRLGQELSWDDFTSGEAALATALNASLVHADDSSQTAAKKAKSPRRGAKTKKQASG